MRIAYFAHVSGSRDPGVIHKIVGQVEQWRAHGHTVRAFIATRDRLAPWQSRLGDAMVRQFDGPISRMTAMAGLVRAMRRFEPAIVYMRWDIFYPPMLWFPPRGALVVEVNTDDLRENALGPRLRSLYNAGTRDVILRRARALVFVTAELSHRETFSRFPNRHCVITNGIDLSVYPVLPPIPHANPRLAFIASAGQPWQGTDKMLTLAALHRDWQFDVIGMPEPSDASPPNVVWHGSLHRAELVDVLANADVGLGALAPHRKSLDEGSSLKIREYLAVGLPVILANIDLDADRLGRYALRIANTETNISDELARIEAFVHRSRGVRVPRSEVAHIDIARKEQQRLALFEDLAGR